MAEPQFRGRYADEDRAARLASLHLVGKDDGSFAPCDADGRAYVVGRDFDTIANQKLGISRPIVEGLIYPGTCGIVAAPPKAGKTNFFTMLAHHLAHGRDYLGFRVARACNVVVAEYEEAPIVQQARALRFPDEMADYTAGYGWFSIDRPEPVSFDLADPAVPGSMCVSIDRGLGRQLTDYLVALKASAPSLAARPTVVFVDTLARAVTQVGGSSYGADVAAVSALTELAMEYGRDLGMDVAFVLVHHTNKGQHEDAQGALSGTNGIAGSVSWDLAIYRDVDKETKARLQTGRLVGHTRMAADDDLTRFVKLSDRGFWELDLERETAEEVARRVRREQSVPPAMRKIISFVRRAKSWRGTAADLVAAAKLADVDPRSVGRMLAKHDAYLAEAGVVRATWRGGAAGKRYQSLKYCGPDEPERAEEPTLEEAARMLGEAFGMAAPAPADDAPDPCRDEDETDVRERVVFASARAKASAALSGEERERAERDKAMALNVLRAALTAFGSAPSNAAREQVVRAAESLSLVGVSVPNLGGRLRAARDAGGAEPRTLSKPTPTSAGGETADADAHGGEAEGTAAPTEGAPAPASESPSDARAADAAAGEGWRPNTSAAGA